MFQTTADDDTSGSRLYGNTPIVLDHYITEWVRNYLFLQLSDREDHLGAIIMTTRDLLCIVQHKLVDASVR